jgi:hypothetical protein
LTLVHTHERFNVRNLLVANIGIRAGNVPGHWHMHIDEQERVALRKLAGELRWAYGTQRESAATT